jgi:hypothetical protein
MLNRYAYAFTLPVTYCYAYMDNTCGKMCVVACAYDIVFFNQLVAFRIQNMPRTHVESV